MDQSSLAVEFPLMAEANGPEQPMIGQSANFQAALRNARLVAGTDVTVLLHGESGSGKELFAQLIHAESRRRDQPLVTVNCAALPVTLAESELFGHRRGAFTGAHGDRVGRVQLADRGTLFLDEIGELPLEAQAKLLRFIERGECQRLGENRTHRVDVRIVSATHRDLRAAVENGKFREDLFYRLQVIPVEVPPLRDRDSDCLLLLDHFLTSQARAHDLEAPRLTAAARQHLLRHSWPGNVREVRNFAHRLVVLMAGQTIDWSTIPSEWLQSDPGPGPDLKLPSGGLDLAQLERTFLAQALEMAKGNKSQAARLLGLTRDTLNYRLQKYALG